MRFTVGFALAFVIVAFVQSKPLFNGVNNLQAIVAQQNLYNPFNDLIVQVTNALSPAQLQTFSQQVLQLAQGVLNGNTDINEAISRLVGELEQFFHSNPQLITALQSFIRQLINIALTLQSTPSFGTRGAFPADLVTLANQLQAGNVQALLAAYPQYTALINQAVSVAAQVISALSPLQIQTLQNLALQIAQNVASGNLDVNTAANQLFNQIKEYLGSNTQLFNTIQSLVQQILNVVVTLPPSFIPSFGTRAASVKPLQISDLATILATYPQYSTLINQLAPLAAQVTATLSPLQIQTLKQLVLSVAQNVINGNLDASTAASQLLAQIQQLLGSNVQLYNTISNAVQQLINSSTGY